MAQSLSNVLLHLIFSTKNRRPFIDLDIESDLYGYIIGIASGYGSFVHKIGGTKDHIHILITLPRTISISRLLEELKKNSSKWMKTRGKDYSDFQWQNGFGVFSVSASQQPFVEAYIAKQKEHHKKRSFEEEFRQFLQLNRMNYDERYVWD